MVAVRVKPDPLAQERSGHGKVQAIGLDFIVVAETPDDHACRPACKLGCLATTIEKFGKIRVPEW